MIQTVCGDIENNKLGICMTHEHVWCDQSLGPKFYLFDKSKKMLNYRPTTDINEGIPRFIDWYKEYHKIN